MGEGADVLEQFCLLAKNARGRACVQIILEATASPGLFAYGELLDMPNIQEVSAPLIECDFFENNGFA